MTRSEFEGVVAEEFSRAVPEKFRSRIRNIDFVVESNPSKEVRKREGLQDDETLLGLYQGVPLSERGEFYGVGAVLPDLIVLYQDSIEEEAGDDEKKIRKVVRDTIWHEVAHHFGFSETEVRLRERERGDEG